MDKKTKTIVVVLLAVVVVGGLYYGVNRWRQQRLANQILRGIYGTDTGLLNKLANNGISNQIAQEMAKQAAQEEKKQKADEAKEAAKTPEDRFNEAEEATAYDANSKAAVNAAKNILEKVFGKAKLTAVSTNNYGSENAVTSIMEFEIARLITGEDLGVLNKALADKGLSVSYSGLDNKTAMVAAGTAENSYSFGFEVGGQTVGVNIIKISQ